MQRIRLLVLPLFLLSIFILSCSDDATNEPATVAVSGVVQKAGTSEGLPGAQVVASRHSDGGEIGRTVTDSSGAFAMS